MEKINKLRAQFKEHDIDGYLIPKNDEFFGEYVPQSKDDLKFISNFSGSYGLALILKKNNFLFVDGRYTVQADNQSGRTFKIINLPLNKNNKKFHFKNKKIGFDPKLFNENFIKVKTFITLKPELVEKKEPPRITSIRKTKTRFFGTCSNEIPIFETLLEIETNTFKKLFS